MRIQEHKPRRTQRYKKDPRSRFSFLRVPSCPSWLMLLYSHHTGLLTMDLKHHQSWNYRRTRSRRRSLDVQGCGVYRCRSQPPADRRGQYLDRNHAVQLSLAAPSAKVKEGIREAGGTPMEFNTIAISDGETMGTEGMRASLVSREVIADSIELVCRGQMFDAVGAWSAATRRFPPRPWLWRA